MPIATTMPAAARQASPPTEPLEQHSLEREGEAVPVESCPLFPRSRSRAFELAGEDRVLVVERLVAARAQDRLSQPLQAEREQQRADDQPKRRKRDKRQCWAERSDDHRERDRRGAETRERRAPAACEPGCEHDRQRLDHLDRAGEERRREEEAVPHLGVELLDLVPEVLLHDAASQLERRRDLALLLGEV